MPAYNGFGWTLTATGNAVAGGTGRYASPYETLR